MGMGVLLVQNRGLPSNIIFVGPITVRAKDNWPCAVCVSVTSVMYPWNNSVRGGTPK